VNLAPAHRVKTLAHEIAHALLHVDTGARALKVLEAESVAYVVCDAIGIKADDWSFGYVRAGQSQIGRTCWWGTFRQRPACLILGKARAEQTSDESKRAARRRPSATATEPGPAQERHDPDGWLYRLELVDSGKGGSGRCRKCANGPGHGPYWYRYRWSNGKVHKRYVGKTLPESVTAQRRESQNSDTSITLTKDRGLGTSSCSIDGGSGGWIGTSSSGGTASIIAGRGGRAESDACAGSRRARPRRSNPRHCVSAGGLVPAQRQPACSN
jgi:hypothetical protein